ncbi:MAG TPA: T9SS type A sorting domain-containing protein, partial [Saprospiraceae bacterium]|nr:T9SS type A sorting domain-containing protein [Saprospiraceae bacterium]
YKVTATLPDGRSETTNVLVIVLPPPFCQGLAAQAGQNEFNDFESFQKTFNSLEVPETPQKTNQMLIYPNPAGDFIKILSGQNIRSVQLTDVSGRLVLNQQAAASFFELDTSRMPEGVYILKIDFENGTAAFEKVVLSH